MAQQDDRIALFVKANDRTLQMAEKDSELAALMPDEKVTASVQDASLTYQQIVSTVLAGYSERPALGSRAYDIVTDSETGDRVRQYKPAYATVTYGELAGQIEAVANFWRHSPRHRVDPDDMVAFIAFNGAEMTAVDLACAYVNAIIVPLQANYPAKDLDEILTDTAPVTLVASIDNLALTVTHALKHESVRSLIVLAHDSRVDAESREIEAARRQLADAGGRIALATFGEAVEEGGRFRFEPLPAPEGGRDRMVMIMYTSGSTGTPKGAIIHEAICANAWISPRSKAPMVSFIFAPMNHSMGRYALYATLAQGGTAYFTQKSDLSTLLEDIQLARPTTLGMIPRICELAQQHYLAEVNKRIAHGVDPQIADREVRGEMGKSFLGDRMTSATVGSAPTTPELREFMSEVFDIPVSDGYGNTESGGSGITFNNRIIPNSVTDFKLVDVPELGYYTSDKPYPRGELYVKTKNMIQGYYKRPDATAAIFDPDGFMKTGDVMEERGPDHIVWLDRRNNVMKLAQGEYVAIGPLESTFLGHGKLINQIYLYGSAQRSFLLGVIVPDVDAARNQLGHEPSDAELRRLVLEDLRDTARKTELRSFEVPRDVLIEREPFSLANGLLSAVGKPLRSNLKVRYADALEAIYQEMDRKLVEERSLLGRGGATLSTLDRVTGAIKLNLGLAELDPASRENYTELGGDSLGAVNMALLLEEIFGIPIAVSSILHPAASPAHLAAQIDGLLAGSASAARYETVHPDAEHVRADELTLDALLGEELLEAAASAAAPVSVPRTVLLTGANGFLGRFLCLEWMEKLAAIDGKVICLVRGQDGDAARQRLYDAIGTTDAALAEHFSLLAARHLEVVTADLSAPRLGLDDATFARLASEVDQIVHVAALVNHRLAYRNLFEPNVIGTAELVRLALTNRLKRFDYVSSVAVVHITREMAKADENANVLEAASVVPIADGYARGYSASKWAGEVILRKAYDRFGLPVNIFRADMILPHSRYVGQINLPDSFTRLLASVIMTGIAPKSFYQRGADGRRQSAHYDGLPVDFVAGAMQQISARGDRGFHTYNLVNMHYDDGISLDTMVDWIGDAGYDILRVDDHGEWFHRFEGKMRNLPDDQRQHSCLPIVDKFRVPHPVDSMNIAHADFLAAVREAAIGPDVPHLTKDYIRKCIADMQFLALVGAPEPIPA